MKYLLSTMISITAFAFFATASSGLAQTPDGDTPAEEAVCDELKADGITKGLYGLCVAFCEAHDAADENTPITEDQLSDILALSPNGRILKNYNRKKTVADPDMPCVQVEEPCPCWTADLIASIDGIHPDGTVIYVFGNGGTYPVCQEFGDGAGGTPSYVQRQVLAYPDFFGPDTGVCRGSNRNDGTGVFEYVTLSYYGPGDTNNTLTSEQSDACLAQVLDCVSRNTP